MKRFLTFVLLAALYAMPAWAEGPAREYAEYLESALPGAAFADADVPQEWTEKLGGDYQLIARTDEVYGTYIASVRKNDSAPLFYGVSEVFGPDESGRWLVVEDESGAELYRIDLGEDWNIRPYEYGKYLLIYRAGACSEDIFLAGTEEGRARLAYRNGNGFTVRDASKTQICVMLHNYRSWQSGATDEPIQFWLDAPEGMELTGVESVPAAEAFQKWDVIPLGVYVYEGDMIYGLVTSPDGKTGVLDGEKLCSAGADYDRVLDLVEAALDYRPGDMDFVGEEIVRAAFQWRDGETVVTDPDALAAVKRTLETADYTVGSVNCPAPAFLVLEFADGSRAELAVAVNSFDLFFYRGVCFTAGEGEDFLELFQIRDTDFYREMFGE